MTIPDNESPPGSKVNSDSGQLPSGSESVVYFSLPSSDNPSNSATGSSDFGYDDSGRPTFRGEAVRILSNHPKAKARRRRKGLENPDGKLLKMLSQTPNAKRVRKRYYRPLEEKFPVFLQDKLHSKWDHCLKNRYPANRLSSTFFRLIPLSLTQSHSSSILLLSAYNQFSARLSQTRLISSLMYTTFPFSEGCRPCSRSSAAGYSSSFRDI